jgi:hypothetical protein
MRKLVVLSTAMLLAGASLSISPNTALAAKHDAYAQRKAECKQEAKAKHFGIHWAKRDRWIKNCIAGHRT